MNDGSSGIIEECKNLGVILYQSSFDEGILLAHWWEDMIAGGEIDQTFPKDTQRLFKFFKMFELPTRLFYTLGDDGRMNRAIWASSVGSSIHATFVGAWFAPSVRHSPRSVKVLDAIYRAIFEFKHLIMGMTKQQRILDLHRKMGYTVYGPIPKLFDDQDAYITFCTKESYTQSRFFEIARRIK